MPVKVPKGKKAVIFFQGAEDGDEPDMEYSANSDARYAKLVGRADSEENPLYNEDKMVGEPSGQNAKPTSRGQAPKVISQQKVKGDSAGKQAVSGGAGGRVSQEQNAQRGVQKSKGRTLGFASRQQRLRKAFGRGGLRIPQQSNQVRKIRPASVGSRAAKQAPPSYPGKSRVGQRGGAGAVGAGQPNWKSGVNAGGYKATKASSRIAPSKGSARNV